MSDLYYKPSNIDVFGSPACSVCFRRVRYLFAARSQSLNRMVCSSCLTDPLTYLEVPDGRQETNPPQGQEDPASR